jgi:hypothetical protein
MDKHLVTVKIWKTTRRLAKILAAHSGVSLVELLNKLVLDEMNKRGLRIE